MNDPIFNVGDKVRVTDPEGYIREWADKFRNREGIVERVGGSKPGTAIDMAAQFHGQVFVRFLKRNGRGKEFSRWMPNRKLSPV